MSHKTNYPSRKNKNHILCKIISFSYKCDTSSNTRYPAIKSAYGFNRRLLLVCGLAVNKDLNDRTPYNVNNLLARNRHRRYNRFSFEADRHVVR